MRRKMMNIKIIYVGLAIICLFIGNNCAKEIKTEDTISVPCALDAKICPDGTSVGRDAYNNCEFKPCPSEIVCIDDVKICPDGSTVGRDSYNDCTFVPCPIED